MVGKVPGTIRLLSLAVIMLLNGCSDRDISDLQRYVAEVKARPKGAIKPLPEIKMVQTYVFEPEGLRDPFKPANQEPAPQVAMTGDGIKPDTTRPREALESYSLDSLRMVGTVRKGDVLWALVQTAEGTIYRVRAGNHMGRNYGRIVRVLDDRIELIEIVPDSPGNWREKEATVALAD